MLLRFIDCAGKRKVDRGKYYVKDRYCSKYSVNVLNVLKKNKKNPQYEPCDVLNFKMLSAI